MTLEPKKKTYGRMITGELITDELIEKFVKKAEEGYDVEEILARQESDQGSTPASSEGDQASPSRPSRQRR
jgi:hypothetical protein